MKNNKIFNTENRPYFIEKIMEHTLFFEVFGLQNPKKMKFPDYKIRKNS